MTAGFNVNSADEFNALVAEDLNDKSIGWKKITTADKLNIAMTIYSRPQANSVSRLWRNDIIMKEFNVATMQKYVENFKDAIKDNQ